MTLFALPTVKTYDIEVRDGSVETFAILGAHRSDASAWAAFAAQQYVWLPPSDEGWECYRRRGFLT